MHRRTRPSRYASGLVLCYISIKPMGTLIAQNARADSEYEKLSHRQLLEVGLEHTYRSCLYCNYAAQR